MGRIAPKEVKPKRMLSKHAGLSWGGKMYGRGDEDHLPDNFPMDGPHWEDWDGKFEKDGIYTKVPHVEPRKPAPLQLQGNAGARTQKERDRDDDPSYSREDDDENDDDVESDAETLRPGYDAYDSASGEHDVDGDDDVQPEIEAEPEKPAARKSGKPAAKKGAAAKRKR